MSLSVTAQTQPVPVRYCSRKIFYHACYRCLTDDGILVAQNGTPFLQIDEVKTTAKNIQGLFADWHFYHAAVPTYIGGSMTFAGRLRIVKHVICLWIFCVKRFAGSGIVTRYDNADIHQAALHYRKACFAGYR